MKGDPDYEVIFRNVREAGSFDAWKDLCGKLRANIPMRMMMAASFASVLLEPLKVLPFVLHVWGTTGTGKTVALMVAMSIWGNPKMGGLVKTMNMTRNAIMRNAAFLCSIPFAGDELQTIKDKWQGNFDQLIYQITEGVDRGRAKATGAWMIRGHGKTASSSPGRNPSQKPIPTVAPRTGWLRLPWTAP